MREYVPQVRALLAGQLVTAGQIVSGPRGSAGQQGAGAPGWPATTALGVTDLPPAPVYLAALGPQMLRLAGEVAAGALLNWATPEHIAFSRARIDKGTARAGRRPGAVPVT